MRQKRRPLHLCVSAIDLSISVGHVLEIGCDLPASAYATTVLRELVALDG